MDVVGPTLPAGLSQSADRVAGSRRQEPIELPRGGPRKSKAVPSKNLHIETGNNTADQPEPKVEASLEHTASQNPTTTMPNNDTSLRSSPANPKAASSDEVLQKFSDQMEKVQQTQIIMLQ